MQMQMHGGRGREGVQGECVCGICGLRGVRGVGVRVAVCNCGGRSRARDCH